MKEKCREKGYTLLAEHKFHPGRKFRFDYCIPEIMSAIEIEGGIWLAAKGRHTSALGYHRDCNKYNEAQLLGWKVFRVTTDHFKPKEEMELIKLIDLIFLSKELENKDFRSVLNERKGVDTKGIEKAKKNVSRRSDKGGLW